MHKHSSSDEKGIFVDSRVGPLCHTREGEDALTELLMKLFSRFHVYAFGCGASGVSNALNGSPAKLSA